MRKQDVPRTDDPGDASVVIRTYLQWVDSTEAVTQSRTGEGKAHVAHQADGLQLCFAVQRGPKKRQVHFVNVSTDLLQLDSWGLIKLGPGIWDVAQSIYVEGQIHAFITILHVPDPAPWESDCAKTDF